MATLLAHIRVHPGEEARFEAAARRLHKSTHSGAEPRMTRYEYWRGQDPGKYYTLLAFEDYHAFLDHQASPYHEGELSELGAAIADIRLEWVDPVAEASPLPPTHHMHPAADASETVRGYAAQMPATAPAWWSPLR